MNKKILVSLMVIGVIAAVAGGSTFALFNDTETSSGNTFTAGELDLRVDWEESYNGEVIEEQNLTDNPGPIFDISDVKPGDHGEATVSLHVEDNPAYVDMNLTQTANFENGCSEPEAEVDSSCGNPGAGEGELGENLYFTVWNDDGDNVRQSDEEVIFNGTAEELDEKRTLWLDGDDETEGIQPFEPSTTEYVGIKWSVPRSVGNEIQTDSKKFNFTFWAEQARHNEPKNMTAPEEPEVEEPEEPEEPGEENETQKDTVNIEVMKHVCDEDIQSREDFDNIGGEDELEAFAKQVLTCPTVVEPGDHYTNGTVHFEEKRDFNFEVRDENGETLDIDDARFDRRSVNESDIGVDVNNDGKLTAALDTSLYVYENVSSGEVNVTETETPGDVRAGALEFTPNVVVENDDASTLLENLEDVYADNDSTIELDTSKDSEDNTITLHVYNFQNMEEQEEEEDQRAAISFASFCVEDNSAEEEEENGDKHYNSYEEQATAQGEQSDDEQEEAEEEQQTPNAPCPEEEEQLVKFEWDGNSFEPEGDAMNISINATEFKDNDSTEPVEANWTSEQEISTAVVKSAQDICNYSGGTSGTVESCGPTPGQQ